MKKPNLFPVPGALAIELGKLGMPVVLRYDIARITWHLYKMRTYEGRPLAIKLEMLDSRAFARVEKALHNNGILKPLPGISEQAAYGLIGGNLSDHHAVICSIDPFCYLSHLSAMEFHGLTDRLPEQIYVSTPASSEWTAFAAERMAKDLGEDWAAYHASGLPLLGRTSVSKLGKRPVHRYASIHLGAFRLIKDSPVRVATLGRTFLDMLREPGLCGGLTHVLQVFKAHAAASKRLIFDELDQHGTKIDKVRAGFILEDIRLLRQEGQLAHRRAERAAQKRSRPRALAATRPDQVFCWDITYLPTCSDLHPKTLRPAFSAILSQE